MESLNLGKIQLLVDKGLLAPNEDGLITMKELSEARAVGRIHHGVKLLAEGGEHLKAALHIEVSQASQKAIAAVEAQGGTVVCEHFNRLALRALLKPEKFEILPRRARPPPKLMPYYLSDENRGYLSSKVQQRKAGMATDSTE
jgi:large subunit ribosomal protein L15